MDGFKCLPSNDIYWLKRAVQELKSTKETLLKDNPDRRILKEDIKSLERLYTKVETIPVC